MGRRSVGIGRAMLYPRGILCMLMEVSIKEISEEESRGSTKDMGQAR